MKRTLTFDVETIPSQAPGALDEFRAAVQAPAQYKKADSIAAWLAENRDAEAEAAWLKTSFDGGAGQIVVIGFAVDDDAAHSCAVSDLSRAAERKVLQDFFCVVTDLGAHTLFVGHNLIGFDLPFIWKRAMVLGVKPPFWFPRAPRPWSEFVADTMLLWDPTQRAGGSMEKVCRAMGIDGKGGMDGSQVWPLVREGRMAEVEAYCRGDIDRTRAIYRRANFIDAPAVDIPFDDVPDEPAAATPADVPASIF
jgi:predicted PolB exonuclease-like 3'-5' exonuclease